jgi:hypothetical protein
MRRESSVRPALQSPSPKGKPQGYRRADREASLGVLARLAPERQALLARRLPRRTRRHHRGFQEGSLEQRARPSAQARQPTPPLTGPLARSPSDLPVPPVQPQPLRNLLPGALRSARRLSARRSAPFAEQAGWGPSARTEPIALPVRCRVCLPARPRTEQPSRRKSPA